MRSKENCDDSTKVMEIAFDNIMYEIIEHVIEGICFEAHRAVKLGYFPDKEYILMDHKFENYIGGEIYNPNLECDIFGNKKKKIVEPVSNCPYCYQKKGASGLGRHIKSCQARLGKHVTGYDSSFPDNNGKRENYESYVEDEDNSDGNDYFHRKKGNDVKRKSTQNYDTMSQEQKQKFLLKHCGVISKRTRKPCNNLLTCRQHLPEDKDKVRNSVFESFRDNPVDDNIDIDTVD